MIGQIDDEHVAKDVADAKALGLDAFAMNIGMFDLILRCDPTNTMKIISSLGPRTRLIFFSSMRRSSASVCSFLSITITSRTPLYTRII
jgi:hypothetical protein